MAQTFQIFGSLCPADTNEHNLYEVPAGKVLVISSLSVCNKDTTTVQFSIAFAVLEEASEAPEYIYRDAEIVKNSTMEVCKGMIVTEGMFINVTGDGSKIAFNVFGTLMDQSL
jgi:hypothetical protein